MLRLTENTIFSHSNFIVRCKVHKQRNNQIKIVYKKRLCRVICLLNVALQKHFDCC